MDLSPRDYRAWYGLGQTYELLRMPYYALYYFRRWLPVSEVLTCCAVKTSRHSLCRGGALQGRPCSRVDTASPFGAVGVHRGSACFVGPAPRKRLPSDWQGDTAAAGGRANVVRHGAVLRGRAAGHGRCRDACLPPSHDQWRARKHCPQEDGARSPLSARKDVLLSCLHASAAG